MIKNVAKTWIKYIQRNRVMLHSVFVQQLAPTRNNCVNLSLPTLSDHISPICNISFIMNYIFNIVGIHIHVCQFRAGIAPSRHSHHHRHRTRPPQVPTNWRCDNTRACLLISSPQFRPRTSILVWSLKVIGCIWDSLTSMLNLTLYEK